jgi:hypothetical protein
MTTDRLGVLEDGLPTLPVHRSSAPFPLAYWKTAQCATVLYLFYFRNREGMVQPSEISFQYRRAGDAWQPIQTPYFWMGTWNGHDTLPDDPTYVGHFAIKKTGGSFFDDSAISGDPAIVLSGRHSPNVTETCLLQGARNQACPATGNFGAWTICTEDFDPIRIEGHDESGRLVGYLEEPLDRWHE